MAASKKIKLSRSAVTGRFVPAEYAAKKPRTTVRETVVRKVRTK